MGRQKSAPRRIPRSVDDVVRNHAGGQAVPPANGDFASHAVDLDADPEDRSEGEELPFRKKRRVHKTTRLQIAVSSLQEQCWVLKHVCLDQREPEESTLEARLAARVLSASALAVDSIAVAAWRDDEDSGTGLVFQRGAEGANVIAGWFDSPSRTATLALVELVAMGKVSIQLASAGGSGGTSESMHVALTQAALDDEPADPADTTVRAWCARLVTLLDWILPEYSSSTHFPDLTHPQPNAHTHSLQEARQPGSPHKAHSTSEDSASPGAAVSPRSAHPSSPRGVHTAVEVGMEASGIYAAVRPTGREPQLQGGFQELTVQLRPYQRRAAAWMVARETNPQGPASHPLWRELPILDGRRLQFNPFTGRVATHSFAPPVAVRGGILADEMGLGKTVELLACVIANRFNGPRFPAEPEAGLDSIEVRERVDCVCGAQVEDDQGGLWIQCESCLAWQHGSCVGFPKMPPKGEYICGQCLRARSSAQVTQPCGATMIVCPAPILQQWRREIDKHTQPGALQVRVYEGQSDTGGVVTAHDLASADIVLTTYDVLRRDLHHAADPGAIPRTLRNRKRYEVLATPLTRLIWWRVCLDEAQLVENGTAAAALLASQLLATHRWAVTGTPINRGLEDLFGLLSFLRADPLGERFWWLRVCQRPYEAGCAAGWARTIAALRPEQGGLLWRSSKADVADEVGLPPQEQSISSLDLSAIERHFYNRQHQECLSRAWALLPGQALTQVQGQGAAQEEETQRRLSPKEEKRLLLPLLRLRQACCHPQVGAGGIKSLHPTRAPMTMDEILEVLITKAKVEAEEAQRLLLFALNGLAALHLLDKEPARAIASYREALQTAEANKGTIKADSLQQLHAMHNLAALVGPGIVRPPGVVPTLRDDQLPRDAEAIREKYMAIWVAKLAQAEKEFRDSFAQMEKAGGGSVAAQGGSVAAQGGSWFLEAIDALAQYSEDGGERAMRHIRDQLQEIDNMRLSRNATSLAKRLKSTTTTKLVLQDELSTLEKACKAALDELDSLAAACQRLEPELVEQAGQCGRCRAELGEAGRVCRHCRLDELLLAWELRLFSLQTRALNRDTKGISAEDALRQAQAVSLRQVGRGGLGEAQAHAQAEGASSSRDGLLRRGDETGVATAEIVHHPSESEQVLRLLTGQLRALRRLPANAGARRNEILADAKAQLDRLEAQRKVFTKGRALSLAQRSLLYARDELEMSTMRMRLRHPGEVVKPTEAHFKLHAAEVPVRNQELVADKLSSEGDLQRTLGTLRYLRSLKEARRKAADEGAGASTSSAVAEVPGSESCPVCHEPLGTELVMLPCAHTLCCKCSMTLVEQQRRFSPQGIKRISCPTCRAKTIVDQLAYVNTGKKPAEQDDGSKEELQESGVVVNGQYGTKLEAVVRRIKWLTFQDPTAGILVFSSWGDVLELLAHALQANHVPHAYARTRKALDAAIANFCKSVRGESRAAGTGGGPLQTLLLPVKQGANGLNLTEAQHVILVEPLLEPAVQAQAIGRVHRIGQTRKTFVHHFIVKDSVEDNVHRLAAERAAAGDVSAMSAKGAAKSDQQLTIRDVAVLLKQSWA